MSKYSAEELAAWSRGRWLEEAPSSLSGVSKDSRDIADGDLYIALRGERLDGHQFCQQAREAGGDVTIISDGDVTIGALSGNIDSLNLVSGGDITLNAGGVAANASITATGNIFGSMSAENLALSASGLIFCRH